MARHHSMSHEWTYKYITLDPNKFWVIDLDTNNKVKSFNNRNLAIRFIKKNKDRNFVVSEIWQVSKNGFPVKKFNTEKQATKFIEDEIDNAVQPPDYKNNIKMVERELKNNPDEFQSKEVVINGLVFDNIAHAAEAYSTDTKTVEELDLALFVVDKYDTTVRFKDELDEDEKIKKYKKVSDIKENPFQR